MADEGGEHVPTLASRSVTSVATDAELRTASEAMQRAAEAMIAATESFRFQFHQQEGRLPPPLNTYHPYSAVSVDDVRHHHHQEQQQQQQQQQQHERQTRSRQRRASVDVPLARTTYGSSTQLPFSSGASVRSLSRPPTIYMSPDRPYAYIDHQTPVTPMSLNARSQELLLSGGGGSRPDLPRLNTEQNPNAFGARVMRVVQQHQHHHPHHDHYVPQQHPPMPDWPPIMTSSTPNLSTGTDAPLLPGGPPPNVYHPHGSPSHMDLYEAAYKMNTEGADRSSKHLSYHYNSPSSADDPSPVVKIGRYTYIRSANGGGPEDYQTALMAEYSPGPLDPKSAVSPAPPREVIPLNDRPHGFSASREAAFVTMVCVSQMLMLAGIAQAMVPAKIIGNSFPGTTFGDMAWYSAAYGLTAGTFVLPAGRLGDLFGHKKMFIIGFIWFGIWSLACGFADAAQQAGRSGTVYFCFARAMQGIGPALLVPNGQAMLGRAYKPGQRKNMVMCLFGASAPLGFVLGAVMASMFSMYATWPWSFWTMAAVCVALAAISVLVMPRSGGARRNRTESLWSQLDGGGMLLGVSGLVLFNFAFNQAPIVSWNTPYTYFILVIGLLLVGAFVFVETVVAHPLVPVSAMRSSTVFVLACTGTGWGCFSIWVFYAILFIENLRGWDPLLTSAAFAPAPLTGLAASLLTGYLMGRIGPPWIMFISMCAFFAGSLLLVTAPVDQSYWFNTFFGILVMPFGMDMSNPAATILLSNSVAKEHQGIAASLVVTVVNYSISIALGFAGTVEVNLHSGGSDLLAGYRGAQYFGLGLGGLGVILGATFLLQNRVRGAPPPGGMVVQGPPPEKGGQR